MSGRINLLAMLLALQLVIIAVVLLADAGFGESEQGPFLGFEAAAVDEIRITGDDEERSTLVLTRAEEGWRLPDGMPADAGKVDEILAKLTALSAPWPVATSGGAAERFEVTEDEFQRHLVLAADGDVVTDLYLGTSPGYQQVHARRADDDAVYSVGLSNYQLPAKSDDWLDKTLLQPQGEVTAVERQDGWQLRRGEEGWLVGDAAADKGAEANQGAAANQKAAEDLVRRISELRVTGVAQALAEDAEPAAVVTVTDDEGPYRLSLFGGEDGTQYQVRSDRRDGVFSMAGYVAEQILVEEQTLVAAADEPAVDSEAEVDSEAAKPSPSAPGAEPGA